MLSNYLLVVTFAKLYYVPDKLLFHLVMLLHELLVLQLWHGVFICLLPFLGPVQFVARITQSLVACPQLFYGLFWFFLLLFLAHLLLLLALSWLLIHLQFTLFIVDLLVNLSVDITIVFVIINLEGVQLFDVLFQLLLWLVKAWLINKVFIGAIYFL